MQTFAILLLALAFGWLCYLIGRDRVQARYDRQVTAFNAADHEKIAEYMGSSAEDTQP